MFSFQTPNIPLNTPHFKDFLSPMIYNAFSYKSDHLLDPLNIKHGLNSSTGQEGTHSHGQCVRPMSYR